MDIKHEKNPSNTLRAFIAIELPEHVQSKLRIIQVQLKEYPVKVTWTKPENIHLTLKFLGDIKPEMVPVIGGIIEEAVRGFQPMKLSSRAVGFFPSVKRPRVMWTGISGQTDGLAEFSKKLDAGLATLGFAREAKAFTGHLTLGRIKEGGTPDLFIDIMKRFQAMSTDDFLVESVNLYKSELMPSGPIYTKLLSIPLSIEN